jgi:hypothetical protein
MPNNFVVRITLDGKERKLKARHRHVRDARIESDKTVIELLQDPWGGYPYLLRALLRHREPNLSLDDASNLIDDWMDNNPSMEGLTKAITSALANYMHIELTPSDEEKTEAEGNAEAPAEPGATESA